MLTCLDLSGEAGPSGSREKHTFLCPCWALPALKSLLLAFLGPQTSPHSLLARVGRGLKEKGQGRRQYTTTEGLCTPGVGLQWGRRRSLSPPFLGPSRKGHTQHRVDAGGGSGRERVDLKEEVTIQTGFGVGGHLSAWWQRGPAGGRGSFSRGHTCLQPSLAEGSRRGSGPRQEGRRLPALLSPVPSRFLLSSGMERQTEGALAGAAAGAAPSPLPPPPSASSPRAGPEPGDAGPSAQDRRKHRRSWRGAGRGSAAPAPGPAAAGSLRPGVPACGGEQQRRQGPAPPPQTPACQPHPSPDAALAQAPREALDEGAVAQPVEDAEVGEAAAGGAGQGQRSI